MSAIDNARASLATFDGFQQQTNGKYTSTMELETATALRDLIAEHERLTAEMQQRELHHFETEALLTQAGIDPDGKAEWEYGCQSGAHRLFMHSVFAWDDKQTWRDHLAECPSPAPCRRPKAGSWQPIHTDRGL